jgi:hypothetical protein
MRWCRSARRKPRGSVAEVGHRTFDQAASAVLEHEPSGGRFVLEEIARLLAVEVGAAEIVVCLNGREDGTSRVAAVWGSDWYERRRLEWAGLNGTLAACLARHRVPAAQVDSTPIWEFDARKLGTRTGWALPLEAAAQPGVVCLLFDSGTPDPAVLVESVREFDRVLARVPGIELLH